MILVGGHSAQLRLVVRSLLLNQMLAGRGWAQILDASTTEQIAERLAKSPLRVAVLIVDAQTLPLFDPSTRSVPVLALHHPDQTPPAGADGALMLPVTAARLQSAIARLLPQNASRSG
jgi:hypothetical protein